jgi:hypothetical protein
MFAIILAAPCMPKAKKFWHAFPSVQGPAAGRRASGAPIRLTVPAGANAKFLSSVLRVTRTSAGCHARVRAGCIATESGPTGSIITDLALFKLF